jgi:predicted nucleotidyltransferase
MSSPAHEKFPTVMGIMNRFGASWTSIQGSAEKAVEERASIARLIGAGLVPADCAFVTFGSLARSEVTPDSDVDWTLLVDGQADPQHLSVAKGIETALDGEKKKAPGPTAVFGGLTFSHDLIHQIGGENDTNRNTTRRILLLLESCEVSEGGVRDRVLRGILRRYLEEDHGYHALHDWRVKVPRFLMNDIVRFWRTMAVDYAQKRRERAGKGWALRNFKLRMSRKLIFAAGLVMCLSCELKPNELLKNAKQDHHAFYQALQDFLIDFSKRPPLEIVAWFAHEFGAFDAAKKLLSAYDLFLGVLSDGSRRSQLEKMDVEEAIHDELFSEARAIGTAFQQGLTELFFHTDPNLTQATQRYGVF